MGGQTAGLGVVWRQWHSSLMGSDVNIILEPPGLAADAAQIENREGRTIPWACTLCRLESRARGRSAIVS